MSLLPWFLKIPGHDQNVRIPSAPFRIAAREDTAATDEPPMTFTWGSTSGSEWDFSFGIPIKQGIPGPIDLKLARKRVRPSQLHPWMYFGPTQPAYTGPGQDQAWELGWQEEQERQYEQWYDDLLWYEKNWYSWGYTDETLPQIVKYI